MMWKNRIPMGFALAFTLSVSAFDPISAQELTAVSRADSALAKAIYVFEEEGGWEESVEQLNKLIASGVLNLSQRTLARKTLADAHLLLEQEEIILLTYKEIVREDHSFNHRSLGEEPDNVLLLALAQAQYEVREEERQALEAERSRTSRNAAFFRSALVPGWGQRYRGWGNRGYVMAGITAGSVVYAIIADKSFRDARDSYDSAAEGEDFNRLFADYSDKADRADLALGIVAAAWLLNVVDAASQGPNITGLPGALSVAPTVDNGVQLLFARSF